MRNALRFNIVALAFSVLGSASATAGDLKFERVFIDDNFPGAYQVEVTDVNGDKKPDMVVVGGGTCAWYENPTWKKRVITTPDQTPGIISSASTDLDGDGKAEVAIAYDFEMNAPKRGKLAFAFMPDDPDGPWSLKPSRRPTPSIHRLRWGSSGQRYAPKMLVVAPIFFVQANPPAYEGPARYFLLLPKQPFVAPADGSIDERLGWAAPGVAECAPVLHAIDVLDVDGDGADEILTADNSGVKLVRYSGFWSVRQLVDGASGEAPHKGCSEVHIGRFANGRKFLATIEPWHGNMVVVYQEQTTGKLDFGLRTVIDNTLDAGHGLWVADVDGDGDDEVFAGHRGKDYRVSAYDFANDKWDRTVIDRDIAAQDLRGGDLDGDGTPDVVAVGGSTHNVVWYRPVRAAAAGR